MSEASSDQPRGARLGSLLLLPLQPLLALVRLLIWGVRDPQQLRFALGIALNHLRSRSHKAGISAIALVSVVGVLVGVTALIMVLAVMEGFEIDLRDKILGSNAHLVVLQNGGNFAHYDQVADQVQAAPGVVAAAPFVYSEAMLRSEWASTGIIIKGIDPARTGEVTDVVNDLKIGPQGVLTTPEAKAELFAQLHDPPPSIAQDTTDTDKLPGIILGEELASQLKVYPGDQVHLINPVGGGIGPLGIPMPYLRPFRVAGIFYSGMYEYDTKWTYVTIPDAQEFLKIGDTATGIEARVADPSQVQAQADELQTTLLYPFFVRTWQDLNQPLFSALKLEKIVMGLILSLIVMVASLNIVGSLILVVVTRSREIAILRAMGASADAVRAIFMLEGFIIGVVGTTLGTILGLIGCWGLARYQFPLDTDVYYVDTLPVVVEPGTVAIVALTAVLIAFFATVYPASLAAHLDPVEGLRYE